MSERAIRSVAVLGGGIVGLSAACAFARALPHVAITLIETPPDPAAIADRLPDSLPAIRHFHRAIGLDEHDLVGSGAASHRIGTRFEGWSVDGAPWVFVHGEHGAPAGTIPFRQLWARARRDGSARPYHVYAAAGVLAQAGKFVHPQAKGPLATFDYALQLDPDRYHAVLGRIAAHYRVARLSGTLAGIERREDGGVAALLLDGDRRVTGDLFLDAAGPSAPLLSVIDDSFESWSGFLLDDRVLLRDSAAPFAPDPVRRVAADTRGWRWTTRLPDREITGICARDEDGEGEMIALRIGRRPQPWRANVLAIGDAAAVLGPLHGTALPLAQTSILRALSLLPGRDMHPIELTEYNRRVSDEQDATRDFLALHYARAPFRPNDYMLPNSAKAMLDLFERRAGLPFREEEVFDIESQFAALFGLGVIPRTTDPVAGLVDRGYANQLLAHVERTFATLPERLPDYRDYLLSY